MNERLILIAIGVSALSASCSRNPGKATYNYVREVESICQLFRRENGELIPSAMQLQDYGQIRKAIVRLRAFQGELGRLNTDGVDWHAVRYAANIKASVFGFEKLCSDTVELMQKEEEARVKNRGRGAPIPTLKEVLGGEKGDTMTMVDAMLRAYSVPVDWNKTRAISRLQNLYDSVQGEASGCTAYEPHVNDLAEETQAYLEKTYPGFKWELYGTWKR